MGLKLLPVVLSLIAGSADVIGFFGLGGLTRVLVASLGWRGVGPGVSESWVQAASASSWQTQGVLSRTARAGETECRGTFLTETRG